MPAYDAVVAAPNSAIDSYYQLNGLQLGGVNLAERVFHTAGGKGINLARAMLNLGGRPLSLGAVAGQAGAFIASQLESEGIPHELVWGSGESRRCNTIAIDGQRDTTVILEAGQAAGPEVVEAFRTCILEQAWQAPYLILTGSLPPGFSAAYYSEVVQALRDGPVKICIDSSGVQLQQAAEVGVKIIKVNRAEFEGAFLASGQPFSLPAAKAVLARLAEQGVELLAVTDGPRGAYLFDPGGKILQVVTPAEKVVSTAGSGDTFLAALVLALGRGETLEQAARLASAAAAANLEKLGCGFFEPEKVWQNLARTRLEQIEGGAG